MERLEARDRFCLQAAVGWLELGNADEAAAELAQVSESVRSVPEVLEVSWQVHAARRDWTAALAVAEELIRRAPERETGWLHRAYALRRAPGGGLDKARAALLPALRRFPKNPLIPFNLACYEAQLGHLEAAWRYLQQAMRVGGRRAIRPMALADEDLAPLWERLRRA